MWVRDTVLFKALQLVQKCIRKTFIIYDLVHRWNEDSFECLVHIAVSTHIRDISGQLWRFAKSTRVRFGRNISETVARRDQRNSSFYIKSQDKSKRLKPQLSISISFWDIGKIVKLRGRKCFRNHLTSTHRRIYCFEISIKLKFPFGIIICVPKIRSIRQFFVVDSFNSDFARISFFRKFHRISFPLHIYPENRNGTVISPLSYYPKQLSGSKC